MFLTQNGPVLGAAEMLSPVSWTQQPFRFVALAYVDQRRLQAITGSSVKLEKPVCGAGQPDTSYRDGLDRQISSCGQQQPTP